MNPTLPPLPKPYLSDFRQASNTPEARLLRLLGSTTSTTNITKAQDPAFVVVGPPGTGKTTALTSVGGHVDLVATFRDGIHYIPIGDDSSPQVLLDQLHAVVHSVVGPVEAEAILRHMRTRSKSTALAKSFEALNDRSLLLLLDDVSPDDRPREFGTTTLCSLICDLLRRARNRPSHLRIVLSTCNAAIGRLVPEQCRIRTEPFQPYDTAASHMLCAYAHVSLDDLRAAGSSVYQPFRDVLLHCAGLPFALALAGCAVRDRVQSGLVSNDDVWRVYAAELVDVQDSLTTSQPHHPPIFTLLRSSLNHLGPLLKKDNVILSDDLPILFSLLGVLKKQQAVPLSVVGYIWSLSQDITLRVCSRLEQLHILSIVVSDTTRLICIQNLVADFCDASLDEAMGEKHVAYRLTVERLERALLGIEQEFDWDGCAPFWTLVSNKVDTSARSYCVQNITRLMTEAGPVFAHRLLSLISDYRWIRVRVALSKGGNDMSVLVDDVQVFLQGFQTEMDEEVLRGTQLILDAFHLSMPFVASNPRELAYQLQGRLNEHAGRNGVVDRLLWSVEKYAKKPWLKPGRGFLEAAGGTVVLNASLAKALHCVAVLPSGEDVVIGGLDGYLAVFSLRYATSLYELHGHDRHTDVQCVAVCADSKTILTGGLDGTVRAWPVEPNHRDIRVLFRNDVGVCSLITTSNEKKVILGDASGHVTVISSSGELIRKWFAHPAEIRSLVFSTSRDIIFSGSRNGTIARWDACSGRELGKRVELGGGEIYALTINGDERMVAFAAHKKFGVLDADNLEDIRKNSSASHVRSVAFGCDGESLHVGFRDGRTAILTAQGTLKRQVRVHSGEVPAITTLQGVESRLLVSVSSDGTLSVQNLDLQSYCEVEEDQARYTLEQFVVLPDRERVLCCWKNEPPWLTVLNLDKWVPRREVRQALMAASTIVNVGRACVSAIAASPDGQWAAVGTEQGNVALLDTKGWHVQSTGFRRLRGSVRAAAISSDSKFVAVGSDAGEVATFHIADGREVPLLPTAEPCGFVKKVEFSEDSCFLIALVRNTAPQVGAVHIWKHVDKVEDMQVISIPFDRISRWSQPTSRSSVLASSSYLAKNDAADGDIDLYDFATGGCSHLGANDRDESGLMQLAHDWHRALWQEESLFMTPFGASIRYCMGSSSLILGRLEIPVCHSFRPEHWTFHKSTGVFVAGGIDSRLVSALLMTEERVSTRSRPHLPSVRKCGTVETTASTERINDRHRYSVFISHAGADKQDLALPLYCQLMERGINTYVDVVERHPGPVCSKELIWAMETADIGLFIASPEFVCDEWTLRELKSFLRRRKEASEIEEKPELIPVFYRLNAHQCRKHDLFEKNEVGSLAVKEGFFSPERQNEMSTEKVISCLRKLASYSGVDNEEGVVNEADCVQDRIGNHIRRERFVERIVEAVVEAMQTQDDLQEKGGRPRRHVRRHAGCRVA